MVNTAQIVSIISHPLFEGLISLPIHIELAYFNTSHTLSIKSPIDKQQMNDNDVLS